MKQIWPLFIPESLFLNIDKSAKEAMQQINDTKYAEQYFNEQQNGKRVIKIGLNFSSDEEIRNIDDYVVEEN